MLKHCVLLLALAVTYAAPGFGASATGSRHKPPSEAEKARAWRTAAVAALIARADAYSLATAAALRHVGPPGKPTALDLAARAAALAPEDAGIGWLHLQMCAATPGCDIRDAATVMRWVDADNGAAWLLTLAAAQKGRDSTEIDRVLADMAHTARFDLYRNRIIVLMVDALDAARDVLPAAFANSDSARLATVTEIASGEIIPPFTALTEACRESGAAAERRELCLELSKTMQRGDTVAAQLVGFNIERRLIAPDGREARATAERKRVLEWRVAAAAKFDDPLLPWTKNARARAKLAHMRTMPREEDVCTAILRDHKMAPDPPEVHP
ncbi:MAG: hypothetical protein NVS9B2_13770 [Steroidobacteraceae bacterium]